MREIRESSAQVGGWVGCGLKSTGWGMGVVLLSMSRIQESPNRRLQPSWKLSDNSRTNIKEHSFTQNSFRLAEKFSPARRPTDPSPVPRSKERIRLHKASPSARPTSPARQPLTPIMPASSNTKLPPREPLVESGQRGVGEKPKVLPQSPTSKLDIQTMLIREEGQLTRAALSQIKIEFANFKRIVLAELKSQKDDIARLGVELSRKIEEVGRNLLLAGKGREESAGLEGLREETQKEVEKLALQVESCPVLGEVKLDEDIQLRIQQSTPSIQIHVAPQPQPTTITPLLPNEPAPALLTVELTERKKEDVPQEPSNPDSADKTAKTLERCSQIAQNISNLTEANTPANAKGKTVQKLAIEEYKQKLIAISRSNDQLLRERSRGKPLPPEDSTRRFKLDKFYNAIEKLKEEVNEIRNISDMKQPRKDRIINAEP